MAAETGQTHTTFDPPRPGTIGVAAQWLGPADPADNIQKKLIQDLELERVPCSPTFILGRGSAVGTLPDITQIVEQIIAMGGAVQAGREFTAWMFHLYNQKIDNRYRHLVPDRTLQVQLVLPNSHTGSARRKTILDLVALLPIVRDSLKKNDHYLIDLYGHSRQGAQVVALNLNPEHLQGSYLSKLQSEAESTLEASSWTELNVPSLRR